MKLAISRNVIWITLAGVFFGLFMLGLFEAVEYFGRNIPTFNLSADYAKATFWSIVIMLAIAFLPLPLNHRPSLTIQWIIRSTITLGAMLYYEYFYKLDAYYYFQLAVHEPPSFEHARQDGTLMIAYLANFLIENVPEFDSYHALKVLWSLIGFVGVYYFVYGFENYTGHKHRRLFWMIGLFPSILFWSSIFGKDPITTLGIGVFFYGATGLLKEFHWTYVGALGVGAFLMAMIRSWLVGIFFAPFAIVFVLRSRASIWGKVAGIAFVTVTLGSQATTTFKQMSIGSQKDIVKTTSYFSRSWSRGGSANEVPEFDSVASMMAFLPQGMTAALFRPLPGEVNNVFGILSGVENLFMIILMIVALTRLHTRHLRDPLIQYLSLTILVWAAFYGFICYQNLGTAVRFRLQVLPMMVVLPYYVIIYDILHKKEIAVEKKN